MALDYVATTTLLGSAASISGGGPTTLTVTLGELGTGGNMGTASTNHSSIKAEGAILAILQKIEETQSVATNSAMVVARQTPTISSRGGNEVQGERFLVTVYSSSAVTPVDPDSV